MATKGKVLQTVIDISGEISPTLGKSLDGVAQQLEGLNVKALAAGAGIAAIGVATGAAVIEAGKYLANLGDDYNSAVNDISAGTGMVGDELEAMSDVLKDVYGSNFGESMEDAASGINAVYQATGLTDDALAETTKAAYALSDTFGYDIAESARAARAMMQNFGVDGEDAMSMIAAGAQNGLDYSGELLDSISEYSVQFSKLGFGADEMFNIFAQGAENGAWNLDKVGDAVKEFSIRAIDGSKTTTEAYAALGLNADHMMAQMAAGGDKASAGFQDVLKRLMEMEDQVERDAVGVALFGTQWEDLGVDAVKAMMNVSDEAYDTGQAMDGIFDVKYDNMGDAFQAVKRQAEVTLLPMASTIANALTAIAPLLGDMLADLAPMVEETTTLMMPFVTDFLGGAMSLLQTVMPLVSGLAQLLLPILSELVASLLPPLLSLFQNIIPPLMQILQTILPPLAGILGTILPIIVQIANIVLPVLLSLINSLLPAIMPVLDILLSLLADVLLPFLEPVGLLVESLLPLVEPLLTGISKAAGFVVEVIGLLGGVLEGIVGTIGKIVGWVADGLNWVVDLIFGGTDDITDAAAVNGYATGGFTDGLSIAGEDPNYPTEAVISFNPAYRSANLAYWAEAGRMLGVDDSEFGLGGGDGGVYYDMGGVTFAPNIVIHGEADKKTIMEAIEDEYPEFIDMLEEWFNGRGKPEYVGAHHY